MALVFGPLTPMWETKKLQFQSGPALAIDLGSEPADGRFPVFPSLDITLSNKQIFLKGAVKPTKPSKMKREICIPTDLIYYFLIQK